MSGGGFSPVIPFMHTIFTRPSTFLNAMMSRVFSCRNLNTYLTAAVLTAARRMAKAARHHTTAMSTNAPSLIFGFDSLLIVRCYVLRVFTEQVYIAMHCVPGFQIPTD